MSLCVFDDQVTGRGVRVCLDWETDMQLTGGRHEVEAEYEVRPSAYV
jgi:xanthine dehydrogenase molybdopterin-binding subunit B